MAFSHKRRFARPSSQYARSTKRRYSRKATSSRFSRTRPLSASSTGFRSARGSSRTPYVSRVASRHKSAKRSNFERQLLLAEGQVYKFTRNVQSEFEVPWLTIANLEPMAQYLYPKTLGAEAYSTYFTPWFNADIQDIMPLVYGTSWYNTLSSEVFDTSLLVSSQARYQVTNGSNTPVNYEKLVFEVKRDVPSYEYKEEVGSGTQNPMDMAGLYLASTGDKTTADQLNANNAGLHTERTQIQNNPLWNHWYTLKERTRFQLAPGQTRTDRLNSKERRWRPLDAFPDILTQTSTVTQPPSILQ